MTPISQQKAQDRVIATSDAFMRRFVVIWIVFSTALWWFEYLVLKNTLLAVSAMVVAGVTAGLATFFRQQQLARYLILLPLIVAIALIPVFSNGVRSPILAVTPAIILLAFWLLGRRLALLVAAFFVFVMILYWWAEAQGFYVLAAPLRSPAVWTTIWVCVTVFTALIAWSLVGNYETNFEQEMQLQSQLTQRNQELQDIHTALVLAKEQAEVSSKAKGDFLANMSHEIRTPMNAILGMLQLLSQTELSSRQLDYTLKTQGAAKSLLGLLNDILDFSKIDAGKMELDLQPFSLERLLEDLSVIVSANIGQKALQVRFVLDPNAPKVLLGDAMRLQQVLINLSGNAVKFTEKGEVCIRIDSLEKNGAGHQLKFSVIDSGIGIAADKQQDIFSDFSQAEASTTRRFGGTGLGLSISKRLVELMGGTLALDSVLGKGSTFHFTLELQSSEPALLQRKAYPVQANDHDARVPPLTGLRLLVVEDNLINQQVAKELLCSQGALVELADNGQLGVAAVVAANPPFDAVLMDIQMPVMDGYAATRCIRVDLGQMNLPIIAMTANAMATDRDACLAAGMNTHVGKPFDLQHLTEVLLSLTGTGAAVAAKSAELSAGGAKGMHTIDVQAAIARLGGNLELYQQIVHTYLAELSEQPGQLAELLQNGDLVGAHRLLHTAKGLSLTVGATDMNTTVKAIEAQVKDPAFNFNAAITQFGEAALRTAQMLGGIHLAPKEDLATTKLQQTPLAMPDQAFLLKNLQELLMQLRSADMQAMQTHASLFHQLDSLATAANVQGLNLAMANMDFDLAATYCEAVIQKIDLLAG
jgi:signal transduction histidine kinase/DNA-binding response OmpR family regulator